MKKFIIVLFILFLFPASISAQIGFGDERIRNFSSDITIHENGSIDVTETINYDFGDEERHGIFRTIPFTKRDTENKRLDLEFNNFKITDEDNTPYHFEKETENEQIILKIGDSDKTITGHHTYIIHYSVKGALGYFSNYDELYWNATGNNWDIAIASAAASITLPESINPASVKTACYTGYYQSTASDCSIFMKNHTIHYVSNHTLEPNQGLTVLTSLPKDAVAFLPAKEHVPFFKTPLGIITAIILSIFGIFWYLLLPIFIIIRYFKSGRDPEVGLPTTAWYDPPKTKQGRALTPSETGALVDEKVDQRDIFATIVDLARRHYITIKEYDKKKFSLVYKNKPQKEDTLLPFEKELLDGIFEDKKEAKLNDVKLYKTIQKVEKMIYNNLVQEGFFEKNPHSVRTKYYILGIISFFTLNFVLGLTSFIFGRIMPKKTLFGAQQANVGIGIKNFLSSQKRQLEFQADNQLFFEKLLPFAVAFGVEKIWVNRFKDFDLKQPDWYQGTSGTTFNPALFASSLSNSYKNFSTASTPPSSSGSGFSSGGGFSGGGGGGGGGGSW